MADPKSIHEFLTGEADNGTLFLVDTPDQQAQSGYTTEKLPITDIGDFINNELQYTQDLDTEDKTVSGAINELHDSIGADVYSTNTSYTAGMYCIYNNTLYRCKASTWGAWDSTKWEAKTIVGAINEVNDKIGTNTAINPTSVHSSISSNQSVFSIKGNILFFSLTFKASSLASWSDMFTFNNLSVDTTDSPFIPLISGDDSARFRFYNDNGVLKLQNGVSLSSNDFYVASGMIFVNQTN